MKRYEEYKDSDVQWFGKIPSHWIIGKLKYMAKVYTGKTPSTNNDNYYKEEDINWITPGDISDNNYYIAEVQNKISRIAIEDNACQLYPSGSIFVVCVGTIGKVCLTTFDASCNQQINVLVPNGCNNKFLTYYIMSIKEILKLNANASLLAIISQEKTKNIVTLIPPINEQQSIASFLDAKTKPIDDIISKREKQIELLEEMKSAIISHAVTKGLNLDAKMKDSGIEWIGEIPEHWGVKRLKFLGIVNNGLTYSPQNVCEEDDGILVLRAPNIQNNKLDLSDKVYVKCDIPDRMMIRKGDILICSRNGSISLVGKATLIDRDITATYGAFMIVFRSRGNSTYVSYLVNTVIPKYKGLYSTTTINQITKTMFGAMYVPVAPINEQQVIASYIVTETSKLDARIAKRRKQIELLQEYKQALITDAVTGKIDVRGFNS